MLDKTLPAELHPQSIKLNFYFIFMCIGGFDCMCIVQCPQRPEENIVAPGTRVRGGYVMPLDSGN